MQAQESSYINIHTHRKPTREDEFAVRNAYLHDLPISATTLSYKLSFGLHPWFVRSYTIKECTDKLIDRVVSEQVFAVGEIGVDRLIDIPVQEQLRYFEAQLNIARAVKKPVILHAVRSYSDLVPYLKRAKVPFIFHGFNGNAQQATELVKYGAILSFGKGLWNDKQADVLKGLPTGAFLLETDTAPLSIADVYQKAAQLRNTDVASLKSALFHTFVGLSM